MSQELLYTSAPRGLKTGSRGFCTVLSTQGMPAPLVAAVESLSGYRPIYPSDDERAARNPVVYSHLKMQATGKTWHVLSRIADYGLDYSQRTNKLAHHVVLDKQSEQLPGGPANLLMMHGFMRDVWEGEPKVVAPKPITRETRTPAGICQNWKDVTGDAGWAGVVAESFLRDPDRLVILLFEPGQEVLPLFGEVISLLPVEKRWDVTFSTYFTNPVPGTTCQWRAIIRDSKEAHDSLKFVNALRIDLTADSIGPAVGGPLVSAARVGLHPNSTQPARRTVHTSAVSNPVEFGSLDDAKFTGDASPTNSKPHQSQPKGPPSVRRSMPTQNRRRKLPAWLVTWMIVSIVAAGLLGYQLYTRSRAPQSEMAAESEKVKDESLSHATDEPEQVSLLSSKKADSPGISPPDTSNETSQTGPDAKPVQHSPPETADAERKQRGNTTETSMSGQPTEPSTVAEVDANATTQSKEMETSNQTNYSYEKLDIAEKSESNKTSHVAAFYKTDWFTSPPSDQEELRAYLSGQLSADHFRMRHNTTPPRIVFMAPPHLDWTCSAADNESDLEVFYAIDHRPSKGPTSPPIAKLIANPFDNQITYSLRVNNSQAKAKSIKWCAIEIWGDRASNLPVHTVFFNEPLQSVEGSLSSSNKIVKLKLQMPASASFMPTLFVDTLTLATGDGTFTCSPLQQAPLMLQPQDKRTATATVTLNQLSELFQPLFSSSGKSPQKVPIRTTRMMLSLTSGKKDEDHLEFRCDSSPLFDESDGLIASALAELNHQRGRTFTSQKHEQLKEQLQSLKPKSVEAASDALSSAITGVVGILDAIAPPSQGRPFGGADTPVSTSPEAWRALPNHVRDLAEFVTTHEASISLNGTSVASTTDCVKSLKDLTNSLAELCAKYDEFQTLKNRFSQLRITSLSISYNLEPISELGFRPDKKPIKAYLINYKAVPDPASKVDPHSPGAPQ